MKVGFVGLGKMGSQIVRKLLDAQHQVVVYDVNPDAVAACTKLGATPASGREELVRLLGKRPTVWLMIPADFVQAEVDTFSLVLPKDSILVDGGNSHFTDTIARHQQCHGNGISYVDVGTSGGVMGLTQGFSMMVGGEAAAVKRIKPLLHILAQPHGTYSHVGPSGYGHYVKMIHNGIEYALMQAYAEGYDLLRYGPLANIDLAAVAKTWQQGSIVASTLNALTADILHRNPELHGIAGRVDSNGEGAWTEQAASQAGIAMPGLRAALAVRNASKQPGGDYFATKLLAAMRHEFGGHPLHTS